MKARSAKTGFLKRLAAAGLSLDVLTPTAGVDAMLAYYEEERFDGCSFEEDGDMLLFQWGINDWGDGPAFEVDITRQLIVADDEESEPRQLRLIFRFQSSMGARAGGQNRWCRSLDELAGFRKFVANSEAFKAVAKETPASVELRYGRV
jgi:hypothetical protein